MTFLYQFGASGMKPHQLVLIAILAVWGSLASADSPDAPTKSYPTATVPGDASEWLQPIPDEMIEPPHKIDEKDAYEVVASAKDYVISAPGGLDKRAFVKISTEDAQRYTGHYYRCPAGKTPYLVRAAYGNPVWGVWEFRRLGRKVLVSHGSLGHEYRAFKSAFILNLDFEPEALYVAVHIAE